MNPCPCGEGTVPGGCRCTPSARARYARRLSGPLVDRFDLRVEVGRPDVAELLSEVPGEPTAAVADPGGGGPGAGGRARASPGTPSSRRGASTTWRRSTAPATRLVERTLRTGRLTGRGLGRVRRVARTIADLAGHEGPLAVEHVSAALALRAEPTFLDGRAA